MTFTLIPVEIQPPAETSDVLRPISRRFSGHSTGAPSTAPPDRLAIVWRAPCRIGI
ncbi:hypothetical protein [Methylobacterium aquaticum]|uniref:hypothetical protein n=1 Tax=Methylobacterium aquaticum TaxID=270351 RepID=UPI000AD8E8DE|nr:hypothetical protein [Methylobacterium aquaticum]